MQIHEKGKSDLDDDDNDEREMTRNEAKRHETT